MIHELRYLPAGGPGDVAFTKMQMVPPVPCFRGPAIAPTDGGRLDGGTYYQIEKTFVP